MQKVKISKRVGRQLYRSSPTILTVVASVGVVTTTIMAVRATPKAIKILKEAELEKGEDLSKLEIIRAAGPIYIPSVLLGVSTIACIFGANALNQKKQASLMSAYAMLNESYKQYRKAAKTVYGEDADDKIHAEMAKDAMVSTYDWGYQVYNMDMDSDSERLLKTSIKKHSPEILTGIGIAGMITTTVMAVRATPKALILIEERKEEIGVNQLEAVDLIKTTWMCYVPAALTGTLSIACLIGASSVNVRRNAALATAYTLSESALKDYQEKVIEMFGEKKNEAVKDAIAKDKVEKNPVVTREVIITEKGNTLCYDAVSGRYFKGDIEKIKKAECELNRQMRDEMYISLNDFYYEIGLDNIKLGDELGWNIDDGYIDLSFSSQLASDGTPCLVIDYTIAPRYDFRNLR